MICTACRASNNVFLPLSQPLSLSCKTSCQCRCRSLHAQSCQDVSIVDVCMVTCPCQLQGSNTNCPRGLPEHEHRLVTQLFMFIMVKQQHSIKCPKDSAHKLNINTCVLAQASNCTRHSAPLRESSWCIHQPSMSQPGWPSPLFFPKVSKACGLPTTERPHPRCPCHSSSSWKGSSQEPQPPALNLNTLKMQSALHLRLK